MKTLKEAFGEKLKELRIQRGLTQEAFAEKIGTNTRQVVRIEHGHSFVSAETLARICIALGVKVHELWKIDWDADITNYTTNTGDSPSITLACREDVATVQTRSKTIFEKAALPPEFPIDKSDEVLCAWARMAKLPINVVYTENNNRKCIKRFYPDNTSEILISENQIERSMLIEEICSFVKKHEKDYEYLKFLKNAIYSFSSKKAAEKTIAMLEGYIIGKDKTKTIN